MLLLTLLFICVVLILVSKTSSSNKGDSRTLTKAEKIGKNGEKKVIRLLERLGDDYTIYHDVYVPFADDQLTQIDHIVLSPFGVFIIETKNYQGTIYGSAEQANWTQVIYSNKFTFYNPLFQNKTHVNAIAQYLHIGKDKIHPIVVFSDGCKLDNKQLVHSKQVIFYSLLLDFIRSKQVQIISEKQFHFLKTQLDELSQIDRKHKRQLEEKHLKQLHVKGEHYDRAIKQLKCPKCNSSLVKRTGKYGEFYGCSNFPKCSFKITAKEYAKRL